MEEFEIHFVGIQLPAHLERDLVVGVVYPCHGQGPALCPSVIVSGNERGLPITGIGPNYPDAACAVGNMVCEWCPGIVEGSDMEALIVEIGRDAVFSRYGTELVDALAGLDKEVGIEIPTVVLHLTGSIGHISGTLHHVEDIAILVGSDVVQGLASQCEVLFLDGISYKAVEYGAALRTDQVVVGIFPIHATCQVVVDNILALGRERPRIVIAKDKLAARVGHIRHLGHVIPVVNPFAFGNAVLYLLQRHLVGRAAAIAIPVSIEGHSHD